MNRLTKFLFIAISITLCVLITIGALAFCTFNINPYSLSLNYQTLESKLIPKEMDEIKIIYFSDLLYGKYTPEETIKKTFSKITELQPDILIFGGDMFDESCDITDKIEKKMISYFSSIDAPLGKFAILGEKDTDKSKKSRIENIYSESEIEILDNSNIHVGNQSKNGIRLIGLSVDADVKKAFSGTTSSEYNLLITHQPDTLTDNDLTLYPIQYALAGNSHGTQVDFPFFGGYRQVKGSESLNRADSSTLSFDYYITTGVGCTYSKARFNSTPEICYIVLRKK